MSNKKAFGKLIAFESIYMLIVIAIACACSLLQIVNKRFDSTYSSFIFSGTNYKYNYFFYFLGFVLFITISFVTYKLVFAKHFELFFRVHRIYVNALCLFSITDVLSRNVSPAGLFVLFFESELAASVEAVSTHLAFWQADAVNECLKFAEFKR